MIRKFVQFVKDCRHELVEKTTWPTKDAVLNSTVVVVISIITVSVALFGIDFMANMVVQTIVVERVGVFRDGLDWVFSPTWGVPLRFAAGVAGLFFVLFVFHWFKKRLAQ